MKRSLRNRKKNQKTENRKNRNTDLCVVLHNGRILLSLRAHMFDEPIESVLSDTQKQVGVRFVEVVASWRIWVIIGEKARRNFIVLDLRE